MSCDAAYSGAPVHANALLLLDSRQVTGASEMRQRKVLLFTFACDLAT